MTKMVWRATIAQRKFELEQRQRTPSPGYGTWIMNPIAIIAFLASINGSTPAVPTGPVKQEQKVERPNPKPAKDAGTPKCGRGGWDYN